MLPSLSKIKFCPTWDDLVSHFDDNFGNYVFPSLAIIKSGSILHEKITLTRRHGVTTSHVIDMLAWPNSGVNSTMNKY